MIQVAAAHSELPEINDLVRVALGGVDDPDAEQVARDVPSRIEDAEYDRRSGKPVVYRIAAPWFPGDLDGPVAGADCALQWVTPRGLWLLPCAFDAQETTPGGLRVWRIRVTGAARREERRSYVRVPWVVPAQLAVQRDLSVLSARARERAERKGIRALLPDLPESIEAQAVNISEGGIRCLGPGAPLPTGLPLVVTFDLEEHHFETLAHVVWSVLVDGPAPRLVESAIAFDDPSKHGERLRPLMFAAQLKARRQGLI